MRAETTMSSTSENSVVRLDDSDTVGNQTSKRFCNQFEFANVNGEAYLLATFGEKADPLVAGSGSRLRFYRLADVRDQLDWDPASAPPLLQPDGTALEVNPTWNAALGERSNFPFVASSLTKSQAFPLGIAVDHPLTNPVTCTAVYVAMGSHGVGGIGAQIVHISVHCWRGWPPHGQLRSWACPVLGPHALASAAG